MRLDLHLHSTASDGAVSPARVADHAAAGRLDVIALADHDTTAGVNAVTEAARDRAIHVIPALEVSSTWSGHDVHVLGYFVDPGAPAIRTHEERAARLREERMRAMIERLAELGVEVEFAAVLEAAGPDRHTLGRPHLARALVTGGHVGNVPEAFARYIGDDCPAFIPTEVQEPEGAVGLILDAGGIPVWAHPPEELLDPLLGDLVEAGLRGLEAYRPRHRPEDTRTLLRLAREHELVVSGGSDWHGHDRGPELGTFYVTSDEVEALLDEGGL